MNMVLSGLQGIELFVYMDDIVNYKSRVLNIRSLFHHFHHSLIPTIQRNSRDAAHAGVRPRYRSPHGLRSLLQGDHRALPITRRSAVIRALPRYTRARATIRPGLGTIRLCSERAMSAG